MTTWAKVRRSLVVEAAWWSVLLARTLGASFFLRWSKLDRLVEAPSSLGPTEIFGDLDFQSITVRCKDVSCIGALIFGDLEFESSRARQRSANSDQGLKLLA
jgi:hypothetical protein